MHLFNQLDQIVQLAVWLSVLPLSWLALRFFTRMGQRVVQRKQIQTAGFKLKKHFQPAPELVIISLWMWVGLELFPVFLDKQWVRLGLKIFTVFSITWMVSKILGFFMHILFHKIDISSPDNLRSRKLRTQLGYLEKVAHIFVWILGGAAVLLSFETVRAYGTSILASAGVASIVLGFAAQKSIGNLIAGFQIAFTQPIRVDDVVVIQGEWGRIEEITLSYVVVRIWDLRRLIIPISYLLENPFENWTRISSSLLGYVLLHFDFSLPLDELRNEFDRIVEKDPRWDGTAKALQVVDSSQNTMVIRCLVGARNSSEAFEFRCAIREQLIQFVQRNYPQSLPQYRHLALEPHQ